MKSLAPLSLIELGPSGVGACIESITPTIFHDSPPLEIEEQANLNAPYLNSGLLVLDLSKLRANQIFERCMYLLDESFAQQFKFHDQSALNYVLNGDFRILEKCWNIQLHRQTYPPSLLLDMIASTEANYHFVTSAKPWKWPSCSPPHQMFYVLMDTIKPGWKLMSNWNRKLYIQRLRWSFSLPLGLFYQARARLRRRKTLSESDFKTASYWKQVHQDFNCYRKHKRTLTSMQLAYKQSIRLAVSFFV
jgi:lipopolysaccharide biosynthesis glycosyltransferase